MGLFKAPAHLIKILKLGYRDMVKRKKMSRSRSKMSENLKAEIAKELGVYDTVSKNGWGDVSSRDCGNMVTKAIEIAEKSVNSQQR